MKLSPAHLLSLICALLLCACQSARGPEFDREAFVTAKPENPANALIYLYRTGDTWGAKSRSWPEVLVGEKSVGVLRYKGYLALEVPAGERVIAVTGFSDKAKNWPFADKELKLELQPGEVRFYKLTATHDLENNKLLSGRMDFLIYLTPVAAESARYEMYGLRLSE